MNSHRKKKMKNNKIKLTINNLGLKKIKKKKKSSIIQTNLTCILDYLFFCSSNKTLENKRKKKNFTIIFITYLK